MKLIERVNLNKTWSDHTANDTADDTADNPSNNKSSDTANHTANHTVDDTAIIAEEDIRCYSRSTANGN